jgi:hypothetical protein
METFLGRFDDKVSGVLNGFDRVRFRGTKRLLAHVKGMMQYLWFVQVLLKDFSAYSKDKTSQLSVAIERRAEAMNTPVQYVNSSKQSKEQTALELAKKKRRRDGLIAVLSCVEPCQTYRVGGNRQTKKLELHLENGKCLHYYHYYLDPKLGLTYTRLQSWFPFTMHIGINGREWLTRQMKAAGIRYVKRDNCFPWVSDFPAAQELLNEQLQTDWPKLLEELASRHNPLHETLLETKVPYYWSVQESEWATDFAFQDARELAALYPSFLRHGIEALKSGDVLRFLGHKVPTHGKPNRRFQGEVTTSLKDRPEGTRIKHQVNTNSLKMYDKQESVLRLETLLIDTSDYKVYRPKEGDEEGEKQWRRLRKGTADLHRRAEVSQKSNERYAASLATVETKTPLSELTKDLGQPALWRGRRMRALNPLAPDDVALLEVVMRGENLLNGFRNRDVRKHLYGENEENVKEKRRQTTAVTRKLQMLRAHGLVAKVSRTHRYEITAKGKEQIAAWLAARDANTATLKKAS